MDSVIDMMHLQELFTGRTRKRSIDRLEAEDIKLKLKGMDRSAVDEKLKNIGRDELAEGLSPRDFQLAVWLQPKGKRNSLI